MTSRILVVEDNKAISDLLATLLSRNGFESKCVNSVEVAQAVLTAGETFDLLLTDIIIPGAMDGLDLAKWAVEHHPTLRIGLMSGFSTSNGDAGNVPVLTKPFREKELLDYLQERLAG